MATVGQQFIFWRWTNDGRRSIQEMAERILVWLPQYPRKNHQRIYLNVRSPYHSDYRQGGHILHRLHQNPETLWWTFGKRLFRQNYPQHTSGATYIRLFQVFCHGVSKKVFLNSPFIWTGLLHIPSLPKNFAYRMYPQFPNTRNLSAFFRDITDMRYSSWLIRA